MFLNSERKLYANPMSLVNQGEVVLIIFFNTKTTHFPQQFQNTENFEKQHLNQILLKGTHDAPEASMEVIDGAAFVNMNRPKSS